VGNFLIFFHLCLNVECGDSTSRGGGQTTSFQLTTLQCFLDLLAASTTRAIALSWSGFVTCHEIEEIYRRFIDKTTTTQTMSKPWESSTSDEGETRPDVLRIAEARRPSEIDSNNHCDDVKDCSSARQLRISHIPSSCSEHPTYSGPVECFPTIRLLDSLSAIFPAALRYSTLSTAPSLLLEPSSIVVGDNDFDFYFPILILHPSKLEGMSAQDLISTLDGMAVEVWGTPFMSRESDQSVSTTDTSSMLDNVYRRFRINENNQNACRIPLFALWLIRAEMAVLDAFEQFTKESEKITKIDVVTLSSQGFEAVMKMDKDISDLVTSCDKKGQRLQKCIAAQLPFLSMMKNAVVPNPVFLQITHLKQVETPILGLSFFEDVDKVIMETLNVFTELSLKNTNEVELDHHIPSIEHVNAPGVAVRKKRKGKKKKKVSNVDRSPSFMGCA
jgi:hypothetical protein